MKNLKLTVLSLAFIAFAASCSKKDHYTENSVSNVSNTTSAKVSADSTGWQSVSQWQLIKQDNNSVYYFNIADKKFTSEVASDGLVLVFKKNAGSMVALPSEETIGNVSSYWYHQVTVGNLLILSDVHNSTNEPGAENYFKYVVITPDQLKSLETQGYTRSSLMNLTFDQAKKLFGFND